MTSKLKLLITLFLVVNVAAKAQNGINPTQSMQIDLVNTPPVIDGLLNDASWNNARIADGFLQNKPHPNKPGSGATEVKMLYDNHAVYISARMFENNPDSINNFLTRRDELGNADWFIVVFNTYQDGINGEGFGVTPAGVQIDIKYSSEDESSDWDAVWESATSIDDKGWIVEMKIPYSALRFPVVENQNWGVNFGRGIRRKREHSWWSYIDPAKDGFLNQAGLITGINNIESPFRLSFFPYTSGYVEHNSASSGNTSSNFNGGLDLKYGITDAFTLDMTLIPDFGQARFDNQILNLSQFEIQFNENRQFFTEGLELFNKAGIFYSRRVGGKPFNNNAPYNSIDNNEQVIKNPSQTRLINASKVSGRNKKGLGVGIFNAFENKETAEIRNILSGDDRTVQTNPYTNYNVLVFDQVLRKNSSITLTNTNVLRNGLATDANVSQLNWQLADKKNNYTFSGYGGFSHIINSNDTEIGHILAASFAKISGNFTFNFTYDQYDDNYNPNDLGFLTINNKRRMYYYMQFAKFKPFSIFNFMKHDFDITYERLYKPNTFVNFATSWSTVYGLRKFHAIGLNAGLEPINTNDFFETRTFTQFYKFPTNFWFGGFFSGNYSRPFALDVRLKQRIFSELDRDNFTYNISPRFRPNDKLFFKIGYKNSVRNNEMGFIENINNDIILGRRKVSEQETSIIGNYTFNNKMALKLILRQYWSTAEYNRFNLVDKQDGTLLETNYEGFDSDGNSLKDISFNAFNIDLAYNWRFAPGSEMSLVWKNVIAQSGIPLDVNYFENLESVLNSSQINSLSLKILYFIDYLSLRNNK